MKRFYCRICQRVKRYRRLPPTVIPLLDDNGKVQGYSEGECAHHNRGTKTRDEVMHRARRVVVPRVKKQPVSTPSRVKK